MTTRQAAGTRRSATTPLREAILRWYLRNRRDLPWRETRDPYAIWVSEIMLQQTRVETVIPYYRRFLARFPSVERLAQSGREEVLAAWSGLGYYGRARHMHEAARVLVREHAGRLPEDTSSLRKLPGIGAYTAAAIASVAFGRAAAAVDGNVIRVLARIHGLKGRRDSRALRLEIERRAEALAAGQRPGDWTQALMELGATVCLPSDPRCDRCPASRHCLARKSGHPDRYPEPARTPRVGQEQRVLLLMERSGRIFVVPDPEKGREEWSIPYAAHRGEGGEAALTLAAGLGQSGAPEGPVHAFRHRTFSSDVRYEVWRLKAAAKRAKTKRAGGRAACRPEGKWISPGDWDTLPMRAPTLKALKRLRRT